MRELAHHHSANDITLESLVNKINDAKCIAATLLRFGMLDGLSVFINMLNMLNNVHSNVK